MLHQLKTCLAASQIGRKTFNNAPHLVLPVVMLAVGVHNGSAGPLFYPEEELRNSAHLWDGKPVLVNHPTNGTSPVSANSPKVWEGQVLGQVWNTRFSGNQLKAEIWLNEDRTKRIAPELLKLIGQGANIDVSTGLFSSDESTTGVWNGERYTAVARRHVPDHLAILPNQRGACSWADGCGIRANTFQGSRLLHNFVETEEPLLLPTLNNEVRVTNEINSDDYDMDITKFWRKS
jgi:hypothetical protein